MVKHILFDIDDTLFPTTEFSSLARKNAVNAMISMGIGVDFDVINAKMIAILKRKGSNYPKLFNVLCKELGIKEPGRYIAAAVAAYHDTKTSIQPFPSVPPTLLQLKQEGYNLYIATNGSAIKQWDKLIRLRLALYFDNVFVSEEVGREKDVFFYRTLLKRLNSRPEDCLMVGDREDADITPARKAGIITVRLMKGKYSDVPSKADHIIVDISELVPILKSL